MAKLEPITRKEQYISRIVGNTDYSPKMEQTRLENFFAEILKEAKLKPDPITPYEKYLAKIAGREIGIPEPVTRLDFFLAKAAGMNVKTPEPITREEIFWSTYTPVYLSNASAEPPLTFGKCKAGFLTDYRIYGQMSRNLFDAEIVQGGLNGGTGAEFDSDNRCRSSYILLNAGTYTISISSSHTIGMFIFSSTNVFETFVLYSDSPITFSLETVKKVRFGFSTNYGNVPITPSDISNIMLNEGSTPLSYEPYGESVGDRTGNLFDGEFLQGYWASADGNFVESNIWLCTQKIPCKANTDYTFTSGNESRWYGIAWYDIAGNYISFSDSRSGQPIILTTTSPANAAFMGIDIAGDSVSRYIHPSDVTDFMLVEGSTSLPYEPYGYRVPVTVEGKNLLPNTATSQTINGVTFTVNADGSIKCDGTATATAALEINVEPITLNGNYTLTGCPAGGDNVSNYKLDVPWRSDTEKYDHWNFVDTGSGVTVPFLNATASNFRIVIYAGYTCNNLTFYPMIRKAEIEDDTYEPYRTPITTPIYLPEQIKKVGDEAEYIDYGEQKQHRVRKNLLQNTATSQTINGVTFTVNANGSVTCNGTATATASIVLQAQIMLNSDSYILTGCPQGGGVNTNYKLDIIDSIASVAVAVDTGSGASLTLRQNMQARIVIYTGQVCNNLTFYPMIRLASIEDDTYEPYIENTDLDVTLPALPTVTGTNVLSVGTEVQPSHAFIEFYKEREYG